MKFKGPLNVDVAHMSALELHELQDAGAVVRNVRVEDNDALGKAFFSANICIFVPVCDSLDGEDTNIPLVHAKAATRVFKALGLLAMEDEI